MTKNRIKILGRLNPNSSQRKIVYSKDGYAPTLQAAMWKEGGNIPFILVKTKIKTVRKNK